MHEAALCLSLWKVSSVYAQEQLYMYGTLVQ